MAATKRDYLVLRADRPISGLKAKVGDILSLTDAQALYDRDLGNISLVGDSPAPPPSTPGLIDAAVFSVKIGGVEYPFTLAQLRTFLGGTTAPTAPPSNALLGINGDVLLAVDNTPLLSAV